MISGTSKAIVFLGVLLLILETVLLVKFSQYGLDDSYCSCAKPTKYPPRMRVLNGMSADRNDFKWTASLFLSYQTKNTERIIHACTCSMISASFVVTAAHCFLSGGRDLRGKPYRDRLRVAAGASHNLTKAYLSEANRRKIRRIHLHPIFEENSAEIDEKQQDEDVAVYHDIALLELEKPFVLGDEIQAGCLYERRQDDFENEFIATGFGARDLFNVTQTKTIQKENKRVEIIVTSDDLQIAKMRQSHVCAKRVKEFDKSFLICMRDPQNRTAIHIGDSGGPVHYVQDKTFIVGVMSLGDSWIEQSLTMVTKIDRDLDWIDSYVKGNRCFINGQSFKFRLGIFLVFIFFFLTTLFAMICLLVIIG